MKIIKRKNKVPPMLTPQPGDVINTTETVKFRFSFNTILMWIVAQGIFAYQRFLRRYPHPAWRRTHSRLILKDGKCLSVTDPICIYEDVEEVLAQYEPENIIILRPKFYDYSKGDGIDFLVNAAEELIGEKYDRGQLVDIMLNRLLGIPDDQFTRIFDAGTARTVCSAGVAACYEHHRRKTGKQWERLFGGMYIERIPPAAFEALPKNADWEMEFTSKELTEREG